MADYIEIEVDSISLAKTIAILKKKGVDYKKTAVKALDWGASEIEKHAKERHFFVGTGRNAAKKAKDGELKFTNPDGSLRFKVRTGGLTASIHPKDSKVVGDTVTASVIAGAKYAEDVEKGIGHRAFPFLRPALEANRNKILARLISDLKALV